MPHCVLTLRLIGLTFDYYDGKKKPEQLSEQQKKMALVEAPSLLEMCGHVYFPGAFLVGPQFSMKRYLDFTRGIFDKVNHLLKFVLFKKIKHFFFKSLFITLFCIVQESGDISQCIVPGLLRAALGFFYLSLYQVASNLFISESVITSESFHEKSFIIRVFLIGLWAKISLYK
jgi:lysophospholipid acyltransferase 5